MFMRVILTINRKITSSIMLIWHFSGMKSFLFFSYITAQPFMVQFSLPLIVVSEQESSVSLCVDAIGTTNLPVTVTIQLDDASTAQGTVMMCVIVYSYSIFCHQTKA